MLLMCLSFSRSRIRIKCRPLYCRFSPSGSRLSGTPRRTCTNAPERWSSWRIASHCDQGNHRRHPPLSPRSSTGVSPTILAVATSAVREATNRSELLDKLQREAGVSVRILSGLEEALLGTQAAFRSLSFRNGTVADLGGGSLQLSHVREEEIPQLPACGSGQFALPSGFSKAIRQLHSKYKRYVRKSSVSSKENFSYRLLAVKWLTRLDHPDPRAYAFDRHQ